MKSFLKEKFLKKIDKSWKNKNGWKQWLPQIMIGPSDWNLYFVMSAVFTEMKIYYYYYYYNPTGIGPKPRGSHVLTLWLSLIEVWYTVIQISHSYRYLVQLTEYTWVVLFTLQLLWLWVTENFIKLQLGPSSYFVNKLLIFKAVNIKVTITVYTRFHQHQKFK